MASNTYYVVVRPSARTVAPNEGLNRRCNPLLRVGVIELILQKVALGAGQILTTEITNLIVQYIEQNLAGLKPRAQETFQQAWDADPELRTGGTVVGVTFAT